MSFLSDFLFKTVINVKNGTTVGVIKNAVFDEKIKKIKYFVVEENGEDENEAKKYALNPLKIKDYKNYAITTESQPKKTDVTTEKNMIGLRIFSTNGKFFGSLKNAVIGDCYEVKSLLTEEKTVCDFEVEKVSSEMIILRENTEFYGASQENGAKKISEQKVGEKANKPVDPEVMKTPKKIIGNYNFLLNRRAVSDVFGRDGKAIVKAGETVTVKHIFSAQRQGKVVELTRNSVPYFQSENFSNDPSFMR